MIFGKDNSGGTTIIGELFVSSVYDVPCMHVRVFDIQEGMLACSYVCTYSVLLGIRLTEVCQQSGINGLENNIQCVICESYS